MLSDPVISYVVKELREKYDCHTIILYGSRARGDFRTNSDYDIAGIRTSGARIHDARVWDGIYLDMFIYSEDEIAQPDENMLTILGGISIIQKESIGDEFLVRLDKLFKEGPKHLSQDEKNARRIWAGKMLDRAREEDIEGNYRRAWLLMVLLEDYFQLRDMWYLGPRLSFAWLKTNDEKTYLAFEHSLQINSTIESIENLVRLVTHQSTKTAI